MWLPVPMRHFAVTTEAMVALAESICSRFRLEQRRFVNSGPEATMDARRVARAAGSRDKLIKMEGSYCGHHDSVLFSVVPEADVFGLLHLINEPGQACIRKYFVAVGWTCHVLAG